MSIKRISDIFSTAYALRSALNVNMVPNKDNVVICVPMDNALSIYLELATIAGKSGSDRVKVAVATRSGAYTEIEFDRPPAPHPGATEPWMCVFDIEVFAV